MPDFRVTNPDLVVACGRGVSIQDSDFSDEQTSNLTGHTVTTASQVVYPSMPSEPLSRTDRVHPSQGPLGPLGPTTTTSINITKNGGFHLSGQGHLDYSKYRSSTGELHPCLPIRDGSRGSAKSLRAPTLYNKLCHCTDGFGATATLCCCNEQIQQNFCQCLQHSTVQNNYNWRPLPPSPTSSNCPESLSNLTPLLDHHHESGTHNCPESLSKNCDSCCQNHRQQLPIYDTVLS